ncbi:MAG: DUF4870 domain-containing protein [bacterium]|jgi:uncharacterized membrane protein
MNTRTGLDHRLLAALSYLGLISLGLVPGILLLLEPENKLIRFHSIQCLFLTLINFIISFICGLPTCFLSYLGNIGAIFSCFITIFLTVYGFIILGIGIFLAIKAYNEEYYKLPIIGDLVEKIAFR